MKVSFNSRACSFIAARSSGVNPSYAVSSAAFLVRLSALLMAGSSVRAVRTAGSYAV
ncbi:hypothetical protein AB0F42_15095 [Streptomyces buecherae]|uniref:hypothetical protein n=1 Tax=Streptomyces buecherae TaxID=2763006 RepID=UPI0033EB63E6